MSSEITDEFRTAMANWVELKQQLTEARKDMKVLNDREKDLKKFISGYMKTEKIDNINLKKGKVAMKSSNKTAPLTQKAFVAGLMVYFDGDEAQVEAVMTCIKDNLEKKETNTISLTGLKA